MRIGFGYDVHRLVKGRDLILGGVKIPYELGLAGHSDADVLIHAVIDAMLGAAGMGDIGEHFPDKDPAYKDADSSLLLAQISGKLLEAGWGIGNIDVVIAAEQPKISPFKEKIIRRMAEILGIPVSDINIKGKTTEGLGFEGHGEGIAAYAVVLLIKNK